jgi:hypothetical protein
MAEIIDENIFRELYGLLESNEQGSLNAFLD